LSYVPAFVNALRQPVYRSDQHKYLSDLRFLFKLKSAVQAILFPFYHASFVI